MNHELKTKHEPLINFKIDMDDLYSYHKKKGQEYIKKCYAVRYCKV